MKSSLRMMMATVAMAAVAFCADNTLGTWKLNAARSKPAAGVSPMKSLTVVRAAAGDAIFHGKCRRTAGERVHQMQAKGFAELVDAAEVECRHGAVIHTLRAMRVFG